MMEKIEKLETVVIDIPNKVFEINGKAIDNDCRELNIEFADGLWKAAVYEKRSYFETFNTDGIKTPG